MAKNARQQKKYEDHWRDFDAIMEWHQDFWAYMTEAKFENIDLRIITAQFKRRMITKGRRNRYYKRNRLHEYVQIAVE